MRRIICNLRPADSISRRDDDHGALHGSADGLAGSVAGATDRLAVISTESNLGPAHLRDMATFQGSLVAVGATDDALGVIWSTTDGQAWKSIAGSTALDGMLLYAVAVGDPGIVVVGWTEADAITPFSADGSSWSRRPLPGSHPGSSIVSVAEREGRFVAVGGGGEPGAVVSWMSGDGRTWSPVSIYEEGNQASLNSVAAGPDGFVADRMYRGHPAVWTSSDGKTLESVRPAGLDRLRDRQEVLASRGRRAIETIAPRMREPS